MAVLELDFYEPDGTTLIGTLDDSELIECEFRPALQELGALSLKVSRHLAAASSALLTKGNLVKVRIPSVDADPIALFVLKDPEYQLIDKDEEGGEHLTFKGPGGLHLLTNARLDEDIWAPGQPRRGNQQIEGQWAWHDVAYGAILVRIIEEGIYQPGSPLGAISIDFDRDVDSDGIPWAVIPEDFQVPTGTDVLTTADRLATGGDLFLSLTPDMMLHAYQSIGRDLSGSFASDNVRFQKAINILTELKRNTRIAKVTHLITRDMDGVFRRYATPLAFDQAVYGYLEVGWTNDPDQVEKTALETIANSEDAAEAYILEITPGFTPAAGEYMPGPEGTNGHFWLGDIATLHTGSSEHDLDEQDVRIVACSIVLDQAADDASTAKAARSFHVVPELAFGIPPPAFSGVGHGPTATQIPGCRCIELCQRGEQAGVAVMGYVETGTAQGEIEIPAGLNNPVLVVFPLEHNEPDFPFSGTFDGIPLSVLAGSEVSHSSSAGAADMCILYLLNPPVGVGTLIVTNNGGGGAVKGYMVLQDATYTGTFNAPTVAQGTGTISALSIPGEGLKINATGAWDDFTTSEGNPVPLDGQTFTEAFHFGNTVETGIGFGDDSPGWEYGASRNWVALGVSVNGSGTAGDGVPAPIGAAGEATHGTAGKATRCDHVHEAHAVNVQVEPFEGIDETNVQAALEALYLAIADVPTTAGDLTTYYEPMIDSSGMVMIDSAGFVHMQEVPNV